MESNDHLGEDQNKIVEKEGSNQNKIRHDCSNTHKSVACTCKGVQSMAKGTPPLPASHCKQCNREDEATRFNDGYSSCCNKRICHCTDGNHGYPPTKEGDE